MQPTTTVTLPRLLRRSFAAGLLMAAAGLASAQPGGAPIRLLVGFPAGAGSDNIARILADKLKDELGTSIVVENRAGAGGQIAAQALKAAAPDGHTLFLSHDHSIAILPQVIKNPGFNPAADFTPVAGFATFANVLAVSGGTPARTIQEYVRWVKTARGGKDTIGVPAPGSIPVFLVQLIGQKYGIDVQAAPTRLRAHDGRHAGQPDQLELASVPDFIQYRTAVARIARRHHRRQARPAAAPGAHLHRTRLRQPARLPVVRHLRPPPPRRHAAALRRQVRRRPAEVLAMPT